MFDEYHPSELEKVISTQYKIVNHMKELKYKSIYQILIVVDDFANDQSFTRNSKLLHSLYIRGRHIFISTITASQVYKAISPIIRKNLTDLYIYRIRNLTDMEAWLEELSGLHDKKTLLKLYNIATAPAYGCLYINLTAADKKIYVLQFFTSKADS
jgi:hypothetical protein